jgi:hypothetical protein
MARSLGIEGMAFEEIYEGWDPEVTPILRRDGFVWFELGEGSMVVVLQIGKDTPVVLLGSEGGAELLAPSVEDFLIRWSEAKTGISEVDGGEELDGITGAGKKALKAWVKTEKVTRPKPAPFDFDRYLEGDAPKAPETRSGPAPTAPPVKGLPSKLAELVDIIGRRADDPAVEAFVAKLTKKKLAQSTTDQKKSDYVTAPFSPRPGTHCRSGSLGKRALRI